MNVNIDTKGIGSYKEGMAKTHKLLVLEDSDLDFALLERTVEKFFESLSVSLQITRAFSKISFEEKYNSSHWDCVVTDFNIPGYSALEAIDFVNKKSYSSCPILVFSGAIGEEMTVEIIKRGAWDLVLKSDMTRLGPSVLQSLRENHSHLKELQAQEAADAASHSRERFLEIVSHDIKTPLTSIQLIAEALQRQNTMGSPAHGQLNTILKNLSRIERIVSDVLNQAKLDSGTLKPSLKNINMHPFLIGLQEEFEELAKVKGLKIVTKSSPDLNIEADPTLLFQALANLLANAIKFSSYGGTITIEATIRDSMLTICIEDEGSGIIAEKIPFIFEKFYRASNQSHGGFGLGLFICREIISAHGGTIKAESEIGKGTRFIISLPATQASLSRVPLSIVKNRTLPGHQPALLLVEDDLDLNDVLTEIFEREGYRVISCSSVVDARIKIKEFHRELSVVVTDFRLGDGTANDVLQILDTESGDRKIKRILLSADWTIDDLTKIPRVDKVLKKPINTEDLLNEVDKLFNPS